MLNSKQKFTILITVLVSLLFFQCTPYQQMDQGSQQEPFSVSIESKMGKEIPDFNNLPTTSSGVLSSRVYETYEPNDTIDEAYAMGSIEKINTYINTPTDIDFFTKYFSYQQEIAVSLNNLSEDYDLYLCAGDGTILAVSQNSGTTDELIQGTINQGGNYLIAVIPYSGYDPTIAYHLYAGDYYKTGSKNFIADESLTYREFYSYSNTTDINLTNIGTIPLDAITTKIKLLGQITGSCAGIHLQVHSSSNNSWHEANYVNRTVTSVSGLYARQNWTIRWYAEYMFQSLVVWNYPFLEIEYAYIPYTLGNWHFN